MHEIFPYSRSLVDRTIINGVGPPQTLFKPFLQILICDPVAKYGAPQFIVHCQRLPETAKEYVLGH